MIELLSDWTFELLNDWTVELLNDWTIELLNDWTIELLNRLNVWEHPPKQVPDNWIDELEDLTCQEKESKVELACKYSKPTARVRWYKNKLEIFQGVKYNMLSEDGIFRLIVNKITKDDAGRYTCSADLKETSCYLTVESETRWFVC